jgi:hypothetical protein
MNPRVGGRADRPLGSSLASAVRRGNIHFGSIRILWQQTDASIDGVCCTFKVAHLEGSALTPRRYLACSTLAAAALLSGCSLLHPVRLIRPPKTLAFQVDVEPDANQDSVVPFDVVVIRDKDLLKKIGQMDAATWFGAQGRCKYRGGPKAKVQFYSWEFVPNQTFEIDVPAMDGAKAVLGFARYSAPGEHRVTFATKGGQSVEMGEDGVHALTIVTVPNIQPPAPTRQKVCPDD